MANGSRPPAKHDPGDPTMPATPSRSHVPVLCREMLEILSPVAHARYIDATFGAGGYTRAILEAADCRVLALDRDPTAIAAGREMVEEFSPRLELRHARFSELLTWAEDEPRSVPDAAMGSFDGIVFDLGVSSMQIDRPERGFSFQRAGPLDMRMSAADGETSTDESPTAADLVNALSETELADILFHYGEERRARAVARAIVAARRSTPFTTTLELAELVKRVIRPVPGSIHPATRTFQALRIAVNQELKEIADGLAGAERLLRPGGKLIVVTFHSLEDRIVKQFLNKRSGKNAGTSRHLPEQTPRAPKSLQLINQKPLTPRKDEIGANPRARSAKLRAARRLDSPAMAYEPEVFGTPSSGERRETFPPTRSHE